MKTALAVLLAAWTLPIAGSAANAQDVSRITFDATLGKGTGRTGGEYVNNQTGVAADALLAARVKSTGHGALVVGLNAGVYGTGPYDAICRPAPGGCVPGFPEFEMGGALIGWQTRNALLRAMAGAAYAQADWDGWSLAWQARLDGALPLGRHIAALGSLRSALIPNYPNGDRFSLYAFGVGLRIQ